MNRIIHLVIPAILAVAAVCSCERLAKYEEATYETIIQASGMYYYYGHICPIYNTVKFDPSFDAESRAFYKSLDTVLTWKRNVPKNYMERASVTTCAVDWRITDISVTTLEDYDSSHPAGSSMDDILSVRYYFRDEMHTIRLADVKYGTIMLCDYHPYVPDISPFILLPPDGAKLPAVEVTVEDSFGRSFTARSGERSDYIYPQEGWENK